LEEGRQAAMIIATCLPRRPASTGKYMVIVVEKKLNNKGRLFVRRVEMLK
jgi:hypothetical protein